MQDAVQSSDEEVKRQTHAKSYHLATGHHTPPKFQPPQMTEHLTNSQ
jgi:hypothetical protein